MKLKNDWLRTLDGSPELPPFVLSFAKAVAGGNSKDDEDEDEDEDDDEDDEDPDADKTDDELRAELVATRTALAKANGQSAKRRKTARELAAELEEARKPKPKKKSADDDDDAPDLDELRREARVEGEKAGVVRAKKAEAKSALLAAGASSTRVAKAIGLLDLDELDLDDDGLDGIDDAIEDLRRDWPELFAKKRTRRTSVAGDNDRNGDEGERRQSGRSTRSASQKAADKLLGKSTRD